MSDVAPTVPLPLASAEQQAVVDAVLAGRNVKVDAAAGTGKTTVAALVADAVFPRRVCVITFNKNLADESNAKFAAWGLFNIRCRTWHAKIGDVATLNQQQQHPARPRVVCATTSAVKSVVEAWDAAPPVARIGPSDATELLFLDEAQDMTALFRRALRHMLPMDSTAPQLVVVGDPKQLLYTYDADDPAVSDFLMRAPTHFAEHSAQRSWDEVTLSTSYRLSPKVAAFVNQVWGTQIVAGNHATDHPVQYWVLDPYSKQLTERLTALLAAHAPGEVAFLNPINLVNANTKTQRPLMAQINRLLQERHEGRRRFNFHTKGSDEGGASTEGKTVAWTFCSSKGCTFGVTVVFNMSVYAGRPPDLNQLGVALSRANRQLVVIHYKLRGEPQPYVNGLSAAVLSDLRVRGVVVCPDGIPHDVAIPEPEMRLESLAVTGITHLSAVGLRRLLAHGTRTERTPEDRPLEYKQTHDFCTGMHATREDVSALYGIGILFALEARRTGGVTLLAQIGAAVMPYEMRVYTVTELVQLVRRCAGVALTQVEKGHLVAAAGDAETLSGTRFAELVRLARTSFPSLARVGVRARKEKDPFDDQYAATVQALYAKPVKTPIDFLALANAHHAFQGTHEVYAQIGTEGYDAWANEVVFEEAVSRLDAVLPPDCAFEVDLCVTFDPAPANDIRGIQALVGRVDAAHAGVVYEVKFCAALKEEHELQALLYAAQDCVMHDRPVGRAVLVNARTGGVVAFEIQRDAAHALLLDAAHTRL